MFALAQPVIPTPETKDPALTMMNVLTQLSVREYQMLFALTHLVHSTVTTALILLESATQETTNVVHMEPAVLSE
jgi:hypothetical protein